MTLGLSVPSLGVSSLDLGRSENQSGLFFWLEPRLLTWSRRVALFGSSASFESVGQLPSCSRNEALHLMRGVFKALKASERMLVKIETSVHFNLDRVHMLVRATIVFSDETARVGAIQLNAIAKIGQDATQALDDAWVT